MKVKDNLPSFGNVSNGIVELSEIGTIADSNWLAIPDHFPQVIVDEYVIMPNHVHGILIISKIDPVGVQYIEPLHKEHNEPVHKEYIKPVHKAEFQLHQFQKTVPGSLGSIIRSYKGSVTRWCSENLQTFKWQRDMFESVIRNESELNRIREYIHYNPLMWTYEKEKDKIENLFNDI